MAPNNLFIIVLSLMVAAIAFLLLNKKDKEDYIDPIFLDKKRIAKSYADTTGSIYDKTAVLYGYPEYGAY